MGLNRSLVPAGVLVLGLAGAVAGMGLQWWVSTRAYPLIVSGKPFFQLAGLQCRSCSKCGVLAGATGAVLGFLASRSCRSTTTRCSSPSASSG